MITPFEVPMPEYNERTPKIDWFGMLYGKLSSPKKIFADNGKLNDIWEHLTVEEKKEALSKIGFEL